MGTSILTSTDSCRSNNRLAGLCIKDGNINNHNITITGGSKLLKYYLSGNYYKQEGTVENSAMERYALRTNISSQLLPFLKLTAIVNVNEMNIQIQLPVAEVVEMGTMPYNQH